MSERRSARIADGSLLTTLDQATLYAENRGDDALIRQTRLYRLEKGLCVCTSQRLQGDWYGIRVVHERHCPRWKDWMEGAKRHER
jgi:hypothetical protein